MVAIELGEALAALVNAGYRSEFHASIRRWPPLWLPAR
jgi:hypothetical protein